MDNDFLTALKARALQRAKILAQLSGITDKSPQQGDNDSIQPMNSPIDIAAAEAGARGAPLVSKGYNALRGMGEAGSIGSDLLPMDQASRMARSNEQGFNPKTMYHGTTGDINSFDPKFLGSNTEANSAKKAYFFASDPSTASDYATIGLRREANEKAAQINQAKQYSQNLLKSIHDDMDKNFRTNYTPEEIKNLDAASQKVSDLKNELDKIPYNYYDQDANVLPVRLRMENPYIHDFKGQEYRDKSFSNIIDQAKAAGHDSVIFKNAYDPAMKNNKVMQDIHAVFDPSQIRSVNAAFDPAKKSSSDILAGLAGAGATASQANDEDEDKFKKVNNSLNK